HRRAARAVASAAIPPLTSEETNERSAGKDAPLVAGTTARAGPGSGVDVVLHEHAAQQLAGGVAPQIVEEDHVARHLVAGQVALDVGLDLLRVGLRLARLRHDERAQALAELHI